MKFSETAVASLKRLGVEKHQFEKLAAGEPVAFLLSGATDGIIIVAQLTPEGRFRVGIYTIKNVGGGLKNFILFDSRAQAAAKAIGAKELEILGVEITSSRLRAALERGGFIPTTFPVPEELGGGIFEAISRTEPLE